MAEGSERMRLSGETRDVICGVQYVKFRKREVRGGRHHTASKRNSARSISRGLFKFARDRLFQTQQVDDKSISAYRKVAQLFAKVLGQKRHESHFYVNIWARFWNTSYLKKFIEKARRTAKKVSQR